MTAILHTNPAKASQAMEQAILCGIFEKPELFNEVVGLLEPDHFYQTPHRHIYGAMVELKKLGEPWEMINVAEWLRDQGVLDQTGGVTYLMDLVLNTVDCFTAVPESMRHYAHKLRGYAAKRLLRATLDEVLETDAALPEIQERIQTVAELMTQKETPDTAKALEEAHARIEARLLGGSIAGLSTGFPRLDAMINGLEPNRLITIAARPGLGKTAFSLNIAEAVILHQARPVLFFSLEMTAGELLERMIKLVANTTYDRGKIAEARAALEANQHRFLIEDDATMTISEIVAKAHSHLSRTPDIGLVVVDYLGKIKPETGKRYQTKSDEIEASTWGLKTLAKSKHLPVIQLCQLNRGIEGRAEKNKPQLSDLRDSGAIEQDSDIVAFLTAEDENRNAPTLTIAKQRNGQTGEILMTFQGANFRFTEARHA